LSLEAIKSAFSLQSGWCAALGSAFTARLIDKFTLDLESDGPVRALVGDWPGEPLTDALALRLAGALHAAALSGRDAALAAQYPAARADWNMDALWPVARAFLERELEWTSAFLVNPPQTNETKRAIALLPAFLQLARFGALHLLELGASAGLNQIWDRFRFETDAWAWGEDRGVIISTDWSGPAPDIAAPLTVASRAGCDQSPLDLRDAEHALRLRAYVWADQPERMRRLEAAMALAADVRIDTADAAIWLERKLSGDLPLGVTVIYHSVVWQYLSEDTRKRIHSAIERAASRADDTHRLAWLRFEPNAALGVEGPMEGMGVLLRCWPGGEKRLIARTDGHAGKVEAL
jgi:hypothetical protein